MGAWKRWSSPVSDLNIHRAVFLWDCEWGREVDARMVHVCNISLFLWIRTNTKHKPSCRAMPDLPVRAAVAKFC